MRSKIVIIGVGYASTTRARPLRPLGVRLIRERDFAPYPPTVYLCTGAPWANVRIFRM